MTSAGIVGCNTWLRLTSRVVGIGPRNGTILPCYGRGNIIPYQEPDD
ncbi:MAG: hypothetical protein LBI03_08500 [Clostridiales bacterium]|nr:hypothetical protein [Clostridiales bacterium]